MEQKNTASVASSRASGSPIQPTPSYASSAFSGGFIPSSGNRSAATEEAEVISRATAQAITAARSIIIAGGTQASALTTAKAAAKSVLMPKMSPGEKPPVSPTKRGIFSRRRNKRQAEIIAQMALVSVNSSFQSSGENPNDPTNTLIGFSRVNSAFSTDTASQYSASVYNPLSTMPLVPVAPDPSILQVPVQQVGKLPNASPKSAFTSPSPTTAEASVPKTINDLDETKPLKKPVVDQVPQDDVSQDSEDSFSISLDESTSEEKAQKSRIPSEMPMPKSTTETEDRTYRTSMAAQSPESFNEVDEPSYESSYTESTGSNYDETDGYTSEDSLSSTNSPVYVKERREQQKVNNQDKSNLEPKENKKELKKQESPGLFNPIWQQISDVFTCGPELAVAEDREDEGDRDDDHADRRDDVTEDEAKGEQMDVASIVRELNAGVKDNTSLQQKVRSPSKKSGSGASMEQLVLQALSATMPTSPAKPTKRPTLNLSPTSKTAKSMNSFKTESQSTKSRESAHEPPSGSSELKLTKSLQSAKEQLLVVSEGSPTKSTIMSPGGSIATGPVMPRRINNPESELERRSSFDSIVSDDNSTEENITSKKKSGLSWLRRKKNKKSSPGSPPSVRMSATSLSTLKNTEKLRKSATTISSTAAANTQVRKSATSVSGGSSGPEFIKSELLKNNNSKKSLGSSQQPSEVSKSATSASATTATKSEFISQESEFIQV